MTASELNSHDDWESTWSECERRSVIREIRAGGESCDHIIKSDR
jgi:hypothetical protein